MSEDIKDLESHPDQPKTPDEDEKTSAQPQPSDDVQAQDSDQEIETTCEDSIASVSSNETTDSDGLTSSGFESEEFFSANDTQEPEKKAGRKKFGLSARMEYLARPKKDFLDVVGYERPDGDLPEKSLPSWPILPLPTKLPAGRYPYEITMTKLGENVFIPPPGNEMDLRDENNLLPPLRTYRSLHDPYLKAHFKKDKNRKHLVKNGFVSQSGRIICSLGDVNEYREYTRRILAERVQQKYRDKQEEEEKECERRAKKKMDEEEEKLRNTRQQTNLRSFIKNAVSSVQERSMDDQRERDRKILNNQIRLHMMRTQRARAMEERHEKVFLQHRTDRNESEEKKRRIQLEMARRDVEHIEKICQRREKERLDRRHKLEDFWFRKAEEQIAWIEDGLELEKKWFEDREFKIARRKNQAVAPQSKHKSLSIDKKRSEAEVDERTVDEILKEEEEAPTLDETLRREAEEKDEEEDSVDKSVLAEPETFINNENKKFSFESDKIIVPRRESDESQPDNKTIMEEPQWKENEESTKIERLEKNAFDKSQPEQDLSKEKEQIKKSPISDKLEQKEEISEIERIKTLANEEKPSEQGKGQNPSQNLLSSDKLKQKKESTKIERLEKKASEKNQPETGFSKEKENLAKPLQGSEKHKEEKNEFKTIANVENPPEQVKGQKLPSSDKLKLKKESAKIIERLEKNASEKIQPEKDLSKEKENLAKPPQGSEKHQEEKNKFEKNSKNVPEKNQFEPKYSEKSPQSFEKMKIGKKPSSSRSFQKKIFRKEATDEQLRSDKSEQGLKKESTKEKEPEDEIENRGVMVVPETFIRSDTSESDNKLAKIKEKENNSENKEPE